MAGGCTCNKGRHKGQLKCYAQKDLNCKNDQICRAPEFHLGGSIRKSSKKGKGYMGYTVCVPAQSKTTSARSVRPCRRSIAFKKGGFLHSLSTEPKSMAESPSEAIQSPKALNFSKGAKELRSEYAKSEDAKSFCLTLSRCNCVRQTCAQDGAVQHSE